MILLDADIKNIGGIGEKKAQLLNKLGLFSLRDCLEYFPRDYEDRTIFSDIRDAQVGKNVCVRATIADDGRFSQLRAGLSITKFTAFDETSSIDIAFFNRPYIRKQLIRGHEYVFFGKVAGNLISKSLTNPDFENAHVANKTGLILPIYPLTAGVTRATILQAVRAALLASDSIEETQSEKTRGKYGLCPIEQAYTQIHFPKTMDDAKIARERVIFDEFFSFSCGMEMLGKKKKALSGVALQKFPATEFYDLLPYKPTAAQARAVQDAFHDMCSGGAMNRLVQGDVGSGKTMVAAACMWLAAKNSKQAALMAPTELLATQHYNALEPLFAKCKITCALLTGSTPTAEKKSIRAALKAGKIQFIIGTHALIQKNVEFSDLALTIADEQHRFGVNQRRLLAEKMAEVHSLLMSATPIPRTLALMIYGDLDISVINELPPGRKPVPTYAVNESYRARLTAFIEKQVSCGGQAYIVCPIIESDDSEDGRKSAVAYQATLAKSLPKLRVALIHGRMKAAEKDAIMASFAAGDIDALVSTTVIEVGVNVPRATLMVVEDADRFGLSQLHQLRGRVGRGEMQSYCILVSSLDSEKTRARLKIMTETNDGFMIAQEDLRMRGPGDFFGNQQHGLPEFKIADLAADMAILQNAQEAAKSLLERDPTLESHELIKAQVETLFAKTQG